MKGVWRVVNGPLITVAVLLVAHAGGKMWMAQSRVVEALMAAGPQLHPAHVAAAAAFVALRLVVFLLLPGAVVYHACTAWGRSREKRSMEWNESSTEWSSGSGT